MHRLRKAMGQRDQTYILSGIVELDDAYFGSSKPNGRRGRGTGKASALVAVSLTEKGHPRFLKVQVSKLDAVSVLAVAHRTICPCSEIHSDALNAFRAALRTEYTHQFQVFGKGGDTLHWVHTLISNMKAVFLETYHSLESICKAILMNLPSFSIAASGPTNFSPNSFSSHSF